MAARPSGKGAAAVGERCGCRAAAKPLVHAAVRRGEGGRAGGQGAGAATCPAREDDDATPTIATDGGAEEDSPGKVAETVSLGTRSGALEDPRPRRAPVTPCSTGQIAVPPC